MARISVDDDGDLVAIRKAYKPQQGTKVEFNVHEDGVSIVANREGWLSLAEWCLIMAHKRMPDYVDPYALTGDVVPVELFAQGDAITALWGVEGRPESHYQDVFFHRRSAIGDEIWHGSVRSGNSPLTQAGAADALQRHAWMDGKNRADVEAKLGSPIFERTYAPHVDSPEPPPSFKGDRQGVSDEQALLAGVPPTTGAVYKADTPEGWIEVRYSEKGMVQRFDFGMTPPWETSVKDHEIVIAYEGE